MKTRKTITKKIEIPEKATAKIEGSKITVSGPAGTIERTFITGEKIEVKQEGKSIIVECKNANRKEKNAANTMAAHIRNMAEGAINGFEYKLQICATHFPMTVTVDKGKGMLIIKNFLGENKDRITKLSKEIDVEVKGDIITVKSADIEKAAQCAATIEKTTKITDRDRRVFEDGIFIISKAGEKI